MPDPTGKSFFSSIVRSNDLFEAQADAVLKGVWLGTVWLTTEEHRLNRRILEKLLKAESTDTVLTRIHSGKPCRVIRTAWSEEWDAEGAPKPLEMPYQQVLIGELLTGVMEHEIEPLMYEGAGQGVAWCNEVSTVEQVVERLVAETREALAALH